MKSLDVKSLLIGVLLAVIGVMAVAAMQSNGTYGGKYQVICSPGSGVPILVDTEQGIIAYAVTNEGERLARVEWKIQAPFQQK